MGEIVMISSGKGGVGKTTTTALVGMQLSQMDKSVVLIDTDFGLRNLDILLGLQDRIVYNIVDVLEGVCSVKQAYIEITSNLYMIPGTKDIHYQSSKEAIHRLLDYLSTQFDYVLVDTPAGITDIHQWLKSRVTCGIVVFTWDKSSISDAFTMSRFIQDGQIPLRCILNHTNYQWSFAETEQYHLCNDFFHGTYIGSIPYLNKKKTLDHYINTKKICDLCKNI